MGGLSLPALCIRLQQTRRPSVGLRPKLPNHSSNSAFQVPASLSKWKQNTQFLRADRLFALTSTETAILGNFVAFLVIVFQTARFFTPTPALCQENISIFAEMELLLYLQSDDGGCGVRFGVRPVTVNSKEQCKLIRTLTPGDHRGGNADDIALGPMLGLSIYDCPEGLQLLV